MALPTGTKVRMMDFNNDNTAILIILGMTLAALKCMLQMVIHLSGQLRFVDLRKNRFSQCYTQSV